MVSRSELATRLARQGSSHAQAVHAVDAVLHEITAALVAGERVALTGFGTFEPVVRPARTARNPRTGAAVQVPAATVARFRAGAGLRGALLAGDAGAAPSGTLPATRSVGATPSAPSPADVAPPVAEAAPLKGAGKAAKHSKGAKAAKPGKAAKASAASRTSSKPGVKGHSKTKKAAGGGKKPKGKH